MSKAQEQFDKLNSQEQSLFKMRHSAEHVLMMAMRKFYPKMKMAMGPATDEGFYFDVDLGEQKITDQDFKKIEKEMYRIINTGLTIQQSVITAQEARKQFVGNEYKQEWINEIETKQEKATIYYFGKGTKDEFVDLCAGPHVTSTKEIGVIKLLSVAGAYWRGDEKNKMLTRIYGTAFASKEDLKPYLWQQEEAKKRDHRKLGQELELFFIDDMVGKGLVMWLPNGTIIREQIESVAKEMEAKSGYVRVTTPHIAKEELFLTSGHLPFYKDSMYPPMVMDDGTYYLKAMNCPHHHRVFQHQTRSYRDLPLRLAEYGTCYRNELSGTLAGLLRVRCMAMNDAHIYCQKEQIEAEFKAVIDLTMNYFQIFGLKDYWFRLSKWDPKHTDKYINEPENWEYSQQVLREVLQKMKVKFVEADDEAAFYGPKVDVQFKSVIGREETMSTIQLDFVARSRFGLTYTDKSGKENNEVFVIHRAPLSVHERFLAFLIEHFAGNFPLWLAPSQVMIIPISEKNHAYAKHVSEQLKAHDIRVQLNDSDQSMQKRIREGWQQKIPYMAIVGDTESKDKTVSIRKRRLEEHLQYSIDKFLRLLQTEIENKEIG